MTYEQAMTVREGDKLVTRYGDVGEVLSILDRGISVHFTLIAPSDRPRRFLFIEAHSSNVSRVEG